MTPFLDLRWLPHGAGLPLPAYQTAGSAGLDLHAAMSPDAPLILHPAQRGLVPTGFALAVPEGFEAQVRPRSGMAVKHGLTVLNAPGTIDADYRGEVMVLLINHGDAPVTIGRGDRIAQLVIAPIAQVDVRPTTTLPQTARDSGGFGSTGS